MGVVQGRESGGDCDCCDGKWGEGKRQVLGREINGISIGLE